MWLVHLTIILVLGGMNAFFAVLYILAIVIYYSKKSTERKNNSSPQSTIPITSYRTTPSSNLVNTEIIDVKPDSTPIVSINTNYSGQDYYYTHDVVRRLNITGKDKDFVQRLWSRRTNFLAIPQCEDETTKLYLYVLHSLQDYTSSPDSSERTKKFVYRLITERAPSIFDSNFYGLGIQSFVNDLYKLCENEIRKNYRHRRRLNEEYYVKGISDQVDISCVRYIQEKLKSYAPESSQRKTKESLSRLTPSAWREELKSIRSDIKQNGYSEKVSNEIGELIQANEFNTQFPEICFEVSKFLAPYDKEGVLFYYSLYRGQIIAKGQSAQDLPLSIVKVIFNSSDQYVEFMSLPLDTTVGELTASIKGIFQEKRRSIIIDHKIVEQKRELDNIVVNELNKILAEEIQESEPVSKVMNLDDIFNSPLKTENGVSFSDIQKEFIRQFITRDYVLQQEHIQDFSRKFNVFPTSLINEINEVFYEEYEDNLIEEIDNAYTITASYRSRIQTL